jgi:hypothetical protein
MTVAQRVHHPPPLLARAHQAGEPQPGQMLADGGTGGAAHLGERADVGLPRDQGMQQGEPGAVTEQGEEFGGERELFLARGARVRKMRR